jgi:hypothetical protein
MVWLASKKKKLILWTRRKHSGKENKPTSFNKTSSIRSKVHSIHPVLQMIRFADLKLAINLCWFQSDDPKLFEVGANEQSKREDFYP